LPLVNSNLAPEANPSAPPDARLAALWRWLPILIILAAAFAYYGSYLRYWFNPHDESGFACLITQRLMGGERPWVDVEPGYNIGWFYPLIALFKITGVNYLAARAWFFALATITALLGYATVTRVSGSRLAGLGVGLLVVMLPGSQFKGYIQLAQAANTACLVYLAFIDPAQRRKWFGGVVLGGVVLGLTYLVRVELGFFFTAIWSLLLLVFLLDRRLPVAGRFGSTFGGLLALVLGVVVAQTPAYIDVRSRGLEKHYLAEYTGWVKFLRNSVDQQLEGSKKSTKSATPAATPQNPMPDAAQAEPPSAAGTMHDASKIDRTILLRQPVGAMMSGAWRDRMLALLTYAPFVGFGVFFFAGLIGFVRSLARGEFNLTTRPFLWLLLVGASLTTFPQFFFFRPDRPHLSEFMTGHIIAMGACLWLLWPRGEKRPVVPRVVAWCGAIFLAGQLSVFIVFAMQHPSSGTIAARTGRKAWFHGQNGVHVREFKRQATAYQGIHDLVMKSSGPSDYVICYPYMPGYNVMTNRRTYLHNVYVDNATHSANWSETTIREIDDKKPAVVIVDDRAINGKDPSRFSRWAPKVLDHLNKTYTLSGTFFPSAKSDAVQVFTRPAPPAP
jgi:hypothetical protein